MDFAELKQILSEQFPKVWLKDGKLFARTEECLWTGEGSTIDVRIEDGIYEVDAFNSYDTSDMYVFGVHKALHNALADYGFFAEFYDAGTVFIYRS